jgi:hypothetical protein
MFVYAIVVYLLYPCGASSPEVQQKSTGPEPPAKTADCDIIGKSTFDMKAEMERKRKQKEEAERKDAIARGEMTEDGKEIAQEVAMEDCEVETKREWKQVPTEELDAMFDEPDYSGEPQAEGVIIDDIDLAFHTVRKKEPTKEEVRKAAETLIQLEGTEFKDEICRLFPEVKNDIDRVMKMYSSELNRNTKEPEPKKVNKKQEKKPFPERFEDFTVEDLV